MDRSNWRQMVRKIGMCHHRSIRKVYPKNLCIRSRDILNFTRVSSYEMSKRFIDIRPDYLGMLHQGADMTRIVGKKERSWRLRIGLGSADHSNRGLELSN